MKICLLALIIMVSNLLAGQDQFNGNPSELVSADGIAIPVYDFDGFKPILKSKGDEIYIINFWATWCKPCVEEIPEYMELAYELERKGVKFLFVSLDFRKNLEKGVISFVKENGMEGRTVLLHDPDANSWIDQVDPSWSGAIPATLVFKGDSRKFFENKLSYHELKTIINSF
jgi:thiol-disulfide isomerase/thioredoxin